jgi:hypothetical protein
VEVLPVGEGGVPARGGVGCGVGSGIGSAVCCPRRMGRGAAVALHLQDVSGYFGLPFCQERHPAVWV